MKTTQERYKEKSINEKLAKYFESNANIEHVSNRENICKFIRASPAEKYNYITPLIDDFMKQNSKGKLDLHISELYKIEFATKNLTKTRDHVIHALNTYLLGYYINDKYLDNKVDKFQWKLAALFHDIGYPIVSSQKIIKRYIQTMGKIENELSIEIFNPVINLVPMNFEKLAIEKNAFNYIQNQICKWDLGVNVQKRYDTMICTDKICHGIIGALTVLHLIDSMYQKHNPERVKEFKPVEGSDWNQEHFENDVVPACSAIFLHDLKDGAFDKIDKNKAPLPYLLKLCDELQNWDRPNGEGESEPSENYGISIEDGKLTFYVEDETKIKDIKKGIKCLNDNSIIVRLVSREGTIK